MDLVGRFFDPPSRSFFLFGPRGTGKSTWLEATLGDAPRLDLLAPEVFRAYQARPERLREWVTAHPDQRTFVIDEIQKAPDLLHVVHELLEARPDRRFVLTGSSARKLRRVGVNLLGGRALLRAMHPFMLSELGERLALDVALMTGLVPLVRAASDPADVLRAYVALYLKEEVQAEGLVRDLGAFSRFLEVTSFSHGATLNVANLAREGEIGRKAAEGYLRIMGDLLLSFEVPVFSRRARRATVVHPKWYLFDAGVFRSLRPTGPLDRPEEIEGAALEGLVAQHLRAFIDYRGDDSRLSFWRTRAGAEVDFVVYGPEGFWAMEVKHAARVRRKDLRGLRSFGEDYPEARRLLLYRGEERLMMDGILCLPVEDFLRSLDPAHSLDVAIGAGG